MKNEKDNLKKEEIQLTKVEMEELLSRVKGIFEGGVTFINPENYKSAMANYYKSLWNKS